MIVNILAGGPSEFLPDLFTYDDSSVTWVGVDRGVITLLSKGINPQYAFGDFDSVTSEEMISIKEKVSEIQKFKPEKDQTDLELALNWALFTNARKIRIFGATGGRLDHLFANIQLLIKGIQHSRIDIEVIDNKNIVSMKQPGTYSITKMKDKQYVSFIPITPTVSGITLRGFKYPLKDCHIPIGSTLCISNELINEHGTFSFSKGILLIIRSSD
ncbi:thiamine diphosphokinase [Bacillus sp. 3H-10]|nr:thiamine diphosphokinase [Bacillus aquiflavi]